MNREAIGKVLGMIIVVVVAWLLALLIVGYVKGDINPFAWTIAERGIHMIIQTVFVLLYWLVLKEHERG